MRTPPQKRNAAQPALLRWTALAAIAATIYATQPAGAQTPQVDVNEIIRRGDMVTAAGKGPRSAEHTAISDALAPPLDDSAKWFFSVIFDDGPKSARLAADLQTAPLSAFCQPNDPENSWSHFCKYKAGDKTQAWRWKDIRIDGYPTVIIQPPRNKSFGDPSAVVVQLTGYDNAQRLNDQLRAGILNYVKTVQAKRAAQSTHEKKRRAETPIKNGFRQADAYSYEDRAPPFELPGPMPRPIPAQTPTFPFPTNEPTPGTNPPPGQALTLLISLAAGLMGGASLTNLLLFALMGVQIYRSYRQTKGLPTILNDAQFSALVQTMRNLSGQPRGPTPPAAA